MNFGFNLADGELVFFTKDGPDVKNFGSGSEGRRKALAHFFGDKSHKQIIARKLFEKQMLDQDLELKASMADHQIRVQRARDDKIELTMLSADEVELYRANLLADIIAEMKLTPDETLSVNPKV